MTSTFLHEDKIIPEDERWDRHAPVCACGTRMWLRRIETQLADGVARSLKSYQCKNCGAAQTVNAEDHLSEIATDWRP